MAPDKTKLTDILEKLEQSSDGDITTVQDVVETFSYRGFGPLLLVPALFALIPTGAIPGVPTIMAICVILIAAQMLIGRESPWLPGKLRELGISTDKVQKAVKGSKKYTRMLDRFLHPRFKWVESKITMRIAAALCIFLALSMVPFELVPFAAALPAAGIALLALALTIKDGLLFIVALLIPIADILIISFLF